VKLLNNKIKVILFDDDLFIMIRRHALRHTINYCILQSKSEKIKTSIIYVIARVLSRQKMRMSEIYRIKNKDNNFSVTTVLRLLSNVSLMITQNINQNADIVTSYISIINLKDIVNEARVKFYSFAKISKSSHLNCIMNLSRYMLIKLKDKSIQVLSLSAEIFFIKSIYFTYILQKNRNVRLEQYCVTLEYVILNYKCQE
jgi:hypothetical protein